MNTINNLSRTLKMDMEGEISLMRRGLWCVWKMGMENVRCLKAQKTTAGRGTSVFAFLHHLNFMYTRSAVLSKYQDSHAENWLPSCEALLNHSTAPSSLCHFMFARICASYILRLILWQYKEPASLLPPKTKKGSWPFLIAAGDMRTCRERQKTRKR